MPVRRGYLIALALAILVGIASIVAASDNAGSESAQSKAEQAAQALARQHLPAALATLQGLTIPANFRRLTDGCQWYRCYVLPQTTPQVAPVLPAIMRDLGADNAHTKRLTTLMQSVAAPMERYSNTLMKRLGVHGTTSRIEGCHTSDNARHGLVMVCAEPAVIDDNIVTIFLGPYLGCPPGPCRWTNQTEIKISYPSGAPQATSQ